MAEEEQIRRGCYMLFTRNYDGSTFRRFVSSLKEVHQIMAEECADWVIDPTQDRKDVLATILTDEDEK